MSRFAYLFVNIMCVCVCVCVCIYIYKCKIYIHTHFYMYSYALHKDVSFNDGSHIRRWYHNDMILHYNIITPLCYSCLQYSVQ